MSAAPAVVLASTSRYRRDLLARLGVPFTCEAPGVDERAASRGSSTPEDAARRLARAKAEAVAQRHPDAVVIGSDQVCAQGDERFGKPGTRAAALAQLTRLRGREHRLVTAVAIVCGGELDEFVDITRLWMRPLGDLEIGRYVDADAPFDCAGSYKLESLGIALFDRLESDDWTAIVGLPLLRVGAALRRAGFAVP